MTSKDTVNSQFFSDGLVVLRHPILLLCTLDISCFYGSFSVRGIRRPDYFYY